MTRGREACGHGRKRSLRAKRRHRASGRTPRLAPFHSFRLMSVAEHVSRPRRARPGEAGEQEVRLRIAATPDATSTYRLIDAATSARELMRLPLRSDRSYDRRATAVPSVKAKPRIELSSGPIPLLVLAHAAAEVPGVARISFSAAMATSPGKRMRSRAWREDVARHDAEALPRALPAELPASPPTRAGRRRHPLRAAARGVAAVARHDAGRRDPEVRDHPLDLCPERTAPDEQQPNRRDRVRAPSRIVLTMAAWFFWGENLATLTITRLSTGHLNSSRTLEPPRLRRKGS